MSSPRWWPLVRWTWVVILVPVSLLALLAAPATGLLTLTFAAMTGAMAWTLARGIAEHRSGTASWVLVAGTGLTVLVVVALVAS